MKSIQVKLSETKTLIVKQLPLRRYAELLGALQNLPKTVGGLEGMSNDQLFEQLPLMIQKSFPDFINILTIATDLTKEELEADDFGLKQAVDVVTAVIEVNDYRGVFEQIKKVAAQPGKVLPSKPTTTH